MENKDIEEEVSGEKEQLILNAPYSGSGSAKAAWINLQQQDGEGRLAHDVVGHMHCCCGRCSVHKTRRSMEWKN